MPKSILRKFKQRLRMRPHLGDKYRDINPEDIFLDSANLPGFEGHALEGRLEQPVSSTAVLVFKFVLAVMMLLLSMKLWSLSVWNGSLYAQISEENRLEETLIFANRGAILDRNGVELATNDMRSDNHFAGRLYAPIEGLSHLVGYIKYPKTDSAGRFYDYSYRAKDGVELTYDEVLRGENGKKLVETDVNGNHTSESVVKQPQDGQTIRLSVDARLNEELYRGIKALAESSGFVGGAGVIMDVETGEILALTSYPEYDQNTMTKGIDQKSFDALLRDRRSPFLNRAIGGLYTPGSILKPIIALSALREGVISPYKEILSTGSISVPNPYDPSKPSVFRDWKAHGWTAMREALAVSSDTYFYSIGGGWGDQRGLGITLIDQYLSSFGLTELTGIPLRGEVSGIIATPEWKREKFDGDIWRLGDTYITTIGQYGTQVTPINAVRFTGALANGGKLLTPSLAVGTGENPVIRQVSFDVDEWEVVRGGMRESVTYGTSVLLNVPYVAVAAKTGTAEVGLGKSYVHSWSIGYFPYEKPRYAWALIMERGPADNAVGATSVIRELLDWMSVNTPEYLQ